MWDLSCMRYILAMGIHLGAASVFVVDYPRECNYSDEVAVFERN
jgi:hypothetical protein